MAQNIFHRHLDWNLIRHVSLIYVQDHVSISEHPALFPSDPFWYHRYSTLITNEFSIYYAVFQKYFYCMPAIPLLCTEQFHSYP